MSFRFLRVRFWSPHFLPLLVLIQASSFVMCTTPGFARVQFETIHHKSYPYASGEWVVKLKNEDQFLNLKDSSGIFQEIANEVSSRLGLKQKVSFNIFKTSNQFALFRLPDDSSETAKQAILKDLRVAYAERNYIYHSYGEPNDESFSAQWGMKNIQNPGADIHMSEVWDEGVTGNKNIKVAIIDTGIDYNHPDLKENVDATLGYNFAGKNADPKDDHNHGTHCAGVIGAVGNNGIGVAGVNWAVTMIPIKFLDKDGSGFLADAVQAVQWATKQNVRVMSNSWGGGPFTQALYDAIEDAKNHHILFVAAAGNDQMNNDGTEAYPAGYKLDNIIAVAATDQSDHLADFSNFGKNTVHVAAPGMKILSTLKEGVYGVMSGTSMAAPHVSGIAALLLSVHPELNDQDLKDRIIRSSDPVRILSRKTVSGGRVNAHNALHEIYPVIVRPNESDWKDVPSVFESPHPYADNAREVHSISVPGAKYIRVIFERLEMENGPDTINLSQADGELIEMITGSESNYVSEFLAGDHAKLTLVSDGTVNKWGFKVAKIQAIF